MESNGHLESTDVRDSVETLLRRGSMKSDECRSGAVGDFRESGGQTK